MPSSKKQSKKVIKKESSGLTLKKISIVILAETHNPSILSHEWFSRYCSVRDKPIQFVHTPEFSMFETNKIAIIADSKRLEVASKVSDLNLIQKLSDIAKKYIDTLPHIPYISIGLNYVWDYLYSKEKELKLRLFVCEKEISNNYKDYKLNFGSIVYGYAADHKLRLRIDLENSDKMIFNFNYSYNIKDKPDKNIQEILSRFQNQIDLSLDFLLKNFNIK